MTPAPPALPPPTRLLTTDGAQQDLLVEGQGALAALGYLVPHGLIDGKSSQGVGHLGRRGPAQRVQGKGRRWATPTPLALQCMVVTTWTTGTPRDLSASKQLSQFVNPGLAESRPRTLLFSRLAPASLSIPICRRRSRAGCESTANPVQGRSTHTATPCTHPGGCWLPRPYGSFLLSSLEKEKVASMPTGHPRWTRGATGLGEASDPSASLG